VLIPRWRVDVSGILQTTVATLPIPAPPGELEHDLTTAKASSLTKFDTGCVGGPNATENEAYRSLLVSNITSEAEKATSQNQNVIVAQCQETLRLAEEEIRAMYDQNIVSLVDFDDKVRFIRVLCCPHASLLLPFSSNRCRWRD
jgi:hypothetical protein